MIHGCASARNPGVHHVRLPLVMVMMCHSLMCGRYCVIHIHTLITLSNDRGGTPHPTPLSPPNSMPNTNAFLLFVLTFVSGLDPGVLKNPNSSGIIERSEGSREMSPGLWGSGGHPGRSRVGNGRHAIGSSWDEACRNLRYRR